MFRMQTVCRSLFETNIEKGSAQVPRPLAYTWILSVVDMIMQYKTHIVGILEMNVGGIYHASKTTLEPLDRLQRTFVHSLNLSEEDAFSYFDLAQPPTRYSDVGFSAQM